MARITVEDCLARIPNRFDLTLLAATRSRQLVNGAAPHPLLEGVSGRNKSNVIALREIAAGVVTLDLLRTPTEPG